MTNEQLIWQYLKQHSQWTDEGIAGVMGNIQAESAFIPNNLQNSYESSLGFTDETYTAAIDNGSYTRFQFDCAGYGLAQWTYGARKKNLLEYAKLTGKSVGDLEMQCAFLIKEMAESFGNVDRILRTTTDIKEASNAVLFNYECPANQGTAVQNVRHGYSLTIYNKNHTTAVEPVEYDETVLEAILAQLRAVNATLASIMEAIKKL